MAKEQPIDERLDEIREDDGQIYVERDKIDFDPDEGLLSGTAIDGTSDIPDDPESVAAAENSENDSSENADNSQDDSDSSEDDSDTDQAAHNADSDSDKPDE